MNLFRGLQAFVRIFCAEMRPLARDVARIFLWGFAGIVGLGLLAFVISEIQRHWQVITAIVVPLVVLVHWVGGLWNTLGLEGRLFFYGLILLWLFSNVLTQQCQNLHRRFNAIEHTLEDIRREVDPSTPYYLRPSMRDVFLEPEQPDPLGGTAEDATQQP